MTKFPLKYNYKVQYVEEVAWNSVLSHSVCGNLRFRSNVWPSQGQKTGKRWGLKTEANRKFRDSKSLMGQQREIFFWRNQTYLGQKKRI